MGKLLLSLACIAALAAPAEASVWSKTKIIAKVPFRVVKYCTLGLAGGFIATYLETGLQWHLDKDQ